MAFNNNLIPLPTTSDFAVYQRLAEAGKLFFYDDHIQILSLVVSPSQDRPGFFGLALNRDNGTVTATYYKYLGRAFLTHPDNLANLVDFTEPELDRIAYWKRSGWVMPIVHANHLHPSTLDRLDEVENLIESNLPALVLE